MLSRNHFMIQNLTKYVDFLVEHNITPKQFLLLYSLVLDRLEKQENGRWYRQAVGKIKPAANMYKYAAKVERWNTSDIRLLVEAGFLIDRNDSKNPKTLEEEIYPDNLEVTPKFLSLIFATTTDFEDFWELYPAFVANFQNPIGPQIPLRMVAYEDCEKLYKKVIHSKIDHSRMMRALRWAVEHNQINVRIDKFLDSRHWTALEGLMDQNYGNEQVRGVIL